MEKLKQKATTDQNNIAMAVIFFILIGTLTILLIGKWPNNYSTVGNANNLEVSNNLVTEEINVVSDDEKKVNDLLLKDDIENKNDNKEISVDEQKSLDELISNEPKPKQKTEKELEVERKSTEALLNKLMQ